MPRRPLLAAYLLLLALSSLVRWNAARPGELRDEFILTGTDAHPPALIITDAGTGQSAHQALAEHLGAERRIFVFDDAYLQPRADPDLRRQAGSIARTLDRLRWPSAHLVAFGTGGAAAILLADSLPDRVRSLTLVEADGVEEFDLLGDHHLNQVLRGAALGASWLVRNAVPHFGALDHGVLAMERTRILHDSDRRPIRAALAQWQGPALILHARHDRRRPLATAREQARLVPQSVLRVVEGTRVPDDSVAATALPFLATVDAGTASTRSTASPARLAAALAPFDAGGLASAQGVSLLVVLALLALTTLLSEDVACIAAGVLAARGSIPLLPGIIACYVGIVVGDQLLYLLGRSAGRALVTRAPIRWILPADRLERACAWFGMNGMRVVLVSRVLPGTRFPVYLAAGILRAGFLRFAAWLMVVGAIWTPALVALSYEATRRGRDLLESLPGDTWIWALLAVGGGALLLRWGVGWIGHRWAGRTPMDEA